MRKRTIAAGVAVLLYVSCVPSSMAGQKTNQQSSAAAKTLAEVREMLSHQPDFIADDEFELLGTVRNRRSFAIKKGQRRSESTPVGDRSTYSGLREIRFFPATGQPLLIVPDRRQYSEFTPENPFKPGDTTPDPPVTLAEVLLRGLDHPGDSAVIVDTKTLDGHECIVVDFTFIEEEYRVGRQAWFAKDLRNLVIRIDDRDSLMTYRNISLDVPDDLFRVPAGFTKVTYAAITEEQRTRREAETKADEAKYAINPTPDPNEKDKVYIPKNLEDAHVELERMLSKQLIKEMREGTEDQMIKYHLELGMWMRNNWGLWRGSRLAESFNAIGIQHPDDMSGIILDTFWARLNGKPAKLEEKIAYYKEYWRVNAQPKDTKFPGCPGGVVLRGAFTGSTPEGKPHTIHYGWCKSGDLWAYEVDKGWYKPDAEVTKRIEDSE